MQRDWPRVWMAAFLMVIERTDNVALACRKVVVSEQTAYHHRRHNFEFRRAWDEARRRASANEVRRVEADLKSASV